MTIRWRQAPGTLRPYVIGFVECADAGAVKPSLALPYAMPVIHIPLCDLAGATVQISGGGRFARVAPPRACGRIFVVALGFSGAALFAPAHMRAAVDEFIGLDESDWNALRRRLLDAVDFDGRADIVEQALLGMITTSRPAPSPCLAAADAIAHDRFVGPVRDLARQFSVEERTLRNRFRNELGWTPKRLLRVARLNRAIRTIHPRPWAGRHRYDARLEFFDDAHFHREFRALIGLSPAAFVAAKVRDQDELVHSLALPALT